MTMLRHAGRVVAGAVPVALLAGLGLPALGALVLLVVLVLAAVCWVINSDARASRVSRMLLAHRGDARCLEPGAAAAPSTSPAHRRRRKAARPGRVKAQLNRGQA
jgi:hypothetical protein